VKQRVNTENDFVQKSTKTYIDNYIKNQEFTNQIKQRD